MIRLFLAISLTIIVSASSTVNAQLKTVPEVFNSLGLIADQDSANVHRIFDWITTNVKYDVRAADMQDATGEPSSIQTPQKVVKNRRGICEGYSNLFKELCLAANIECEKVVGYVADANRKFYQRASLESHAWNAVKVDGEWFIVDCTWGSGGVDEDKKFRFDQDLNYFLASSEFMAASHYPMDPIWQLRPDPISLSDFKNGQIQNSESSMNPSEMIETQLSMTGMDSLMFANERIILFDPANTMALSEITMAFLNQAQQITVAQHNRLLDAQKKHLVLSNESNYYDELKQINQLTQSGSAYLERMNAKGDVAVAQYKKEAQLSVQELEQYVKDQEKWLREYFKNPRPL